MAKRILIGTFALLVVCFLVYSSMHSSHHHAPAEETTALPSGRSEERLFPRLPHRSEERRPSSFPFRDGPVKSHGARELERSSSILPSNQPNVRKALYEEARAASKNTGGVLLSNESRKYRALTKYVAVPKNAPSSGAIGTYMGYPILAVATNTPHPPDSLPLVVDADSQAVGVVTGTLFVRLAQADTAPSVSKEFNLELVHTFERVSTAAFRVRNREITAIQEMILELRKDPRVGNVEIDIQTSEAGW